MKLTRVLHYYTVADDCTVPGYLIVPGYPTVAAYALSPVTVIGYYVITGLLGCCLCNLLTPFSLDSERFSDYLVAISLH